MNPTEEQQAAVRMARQGATMKIGAGAGTGKTTTLELCADALAPRQGAALVFNKATADEMGLRLAAKNIRNVEARTAHSHAYRGVDVRRRFRAKLDMRTGPWMVGDWCGVPKEGVAGRQRGAVVRAILATTRAFQQSGDRALDAQHLPRDHQRWALGVLEHADGTDGLVTVTEDDRREAREALDAFTTFVVGAARHYWQLMLTDPNVGISHDFYLKCQPPGTMVMRPGGSTTPIEDVRVGDRVVSWGGTRLGRLRRSGSIVAHVATRHYLGPMVTVLSASGRRSSYTHDHICIARIGAALDGRTVVYLMRRNGQFRIGRTPWRYGSQGNTIGIVTRARNQDADAVWVLSSHADTREAALAEAVAQHRYGIPGWQFSSDNELMPLDQFWKTVGDNERRARQCLADHGRDILYPLWEPDGPRQWNRSAIEVRACNLMDGMRVCDVTNLKPDARGQMITGSWTEAWQPITVSSETYEGPVHSIEVEGDHTYVADSIVTHNCWHLEGARLGGGGFGGGPRVGFVLSDESQDLNGVTAAILAEQDVQVVYVGDEHQQIYEWRGSVNMMQRIDAPITHLTQSFRWGPEVARVANAILALKEPTPPALRGWPERDTRLATIPPGERHTVICRTNVRVFRHALELVDAGRAIAVVGSLAGPVRLMRSAYALWSGRGTVTDPEVQVFQEWDELLLASEDDPTLHLVVDMVEAHQHDLLAICDRLERAGEVPEQRADVVLTTAHKAKGREWDRVKLAGDFRSPLGLLRAGLELREEEVNVLYVAATRARRVLELNGAVTELLDPGAVEDARAAGEARMEGGAR